MHASSLSNATRSTVLFVVVAISSLAPSAAAQVAAPLPILSSIASATNPDAILVRGEGFTAGSEVLIAVLDPWGERLFETRWTTASETTFDMLGHDDPALGYRPGGEVFEIFEHLCGQQVMVRAYDHIVGLWSNVVDLVAAC